jgi:hypothetical protein
LASPNSQNVQVVHEPEAFLSTVSKFEDTCRHNRVKVHENEKSVDYPEERNWTLHSDAMFQFLGFGSYSSNIRSTTSQRRQCSSVAEITTSVMSEYGSDTSCIVPWQSTESICRIFSEYSTVIWTGDSLTRHTVAALFQYMRENYVNGGFPPNTAPHVLNGCNCDGQFSEIRMCRVFDIREYAITPARTFSATKFFCGASVSKDFIFRHWIPPPEHYKTTFNELCSNSVSSGVQSQQRLRFVYIQGGAHHKSDPDLWFKEMLRPALEAILEVTKTCSYPIQDRVRMVISGINVCDHRKTERFPHQNKSAVFAFMPTIQRLVNLTFPSFPIPMAMLDFSKVTERAIEEGRTSEGCHFMTDVNMMKFMTIADLMAAMAEM